MAGVQMGVAAELLDGPFEFQHIHRLILFNLICLKDLVVLQVNRPQIQISILRIVRLLCHHNSCAR